MAGTIIADYIRADANKISLNVGNTTIASINASGILSNTGTVIVGPNGALGAGATIANSSITGTITQSQIADSSISTGKIVDAAVTNAKLVNGYPNLDYVTPVNMAYQNMGTSGTQYNLGSISIPSAGDWIVKTHCRWGFTTYSGFLRTYLSTTTGSAGAFTIQRMQWERITASGGNLGLFTDWHIRIGTGATFPYTIYLIAHQEGSGTSFLQQDSNGYNTLGAIKIASTTSTGSTPVQIGY